MSVSRKRKLVKMDVTYKSLIDSGPSACIGSNIMASVGSSHNVDEESKVYLDPKKVLKSKFGGK